MLRPIPTWYQGIKFASTLEADWAATFDDWGWFWQYEPEGIQLPSGTWYRPDFHLPDQKVWCEVKGPHNERISKAAELQEALFAEEEEWLQFDAHLVVILRPPGPGDTAMWEGALSRQDMVLMRCSECEHLVWMDYEGLWSCRHHLATNWAKNKPWRPDGALYRPDQLSFTRVPRPPSRGAA